MACQSSSGTGITAVKTDPHSPAAIRGRATLLNQKPFYEAFSVKQEDPMYLEEDKRVKIW